MSEPGLVGETVQQMLNSGSQDIYLNVIHLVDRLVLGKVMEQCQGNQLQAAKRLGLSRLTLRTKLQELGLKTTWKVPTTAPGRMN